MMYFSLYFEQNDERNKTTQILVQATNKQEASIKEEACRVLLPLGEWLYNGVAQVPPKCEKQFLDAFPLLQE